MSVFYESVKTMRKNLTLTNRSNTVSTSKYITGIATSGLRPEVKIWISST